MQADGRQGEKMAAEYLIRKGYEIIQYNYYTRWGEIDLIVWDGYKKELVFVEVKMRRSKKFGYPEEAVDDYKLEKIMNSSDKYLMEVGYRGAYRFDCVAIELNSAVKITHLKNIN